MWIPKIISNVFKMIRIYIVIGVPTLCCAGMSDEHKRFNYTIQSEEKSNFRHMRNATRYISHPYQSTQQLETNIQTDLSHPGNAYLPPRLVRDQILPESPASAGTPNDEAKQAETIKLPENLENLPKADEFPAKRGRWNTNEEILALLLNFSRHEEWQSKDVVIRPESGSMLMYSRKKVRYRRDGYCWKKRKDGKTTREDHMKLKVQGVECIYGCYVHSAVLPTFHRRCYWLLQNPDIVLVHYLNVPYPDDSKLAALIPNIAFWTEKKEWTREELLLQLKPMYENPALEGGKENETEEAKLNRVNQVSSFIESMIAQLLEKQRYVRAALANSLECGCGNRKCLGAARCTRPIRRISAAKKQGKRVNVNVKLQEKRAIANCERNVFKTTAIKKLSGVSVENRQHNSPPSSTPAYYNNRMQINSESDLPPQPPSQEPQLQQLITPPSDMHQPMSQTPEAPSKLHHQQLMQTTSTKDALTSYSRPEDYMHNVNFVSTENRQYQSNYACSLNEQYVPNNEIEITGDEKQELKINENVSTLIPYNHEENEYPTDKYQRDTPDGSESNSYSTIHHQASPDDSFTSLEDAETYATGDLLDDLIMNVNPCYNYENADYNNADRSLYELIIQLTQKEKKTACSNSLVTQEKLQQQYETQIENSENFSNMFENSLPPVPDANANFLNSCSRYSTIAPDEPMSHNNHNHNILVSDFSRIENSYMTNYSTEVDVNFMNVSHEFNSNERCTSNQSIHDTGQTDTTYGIIELAPEWSYCEGGTKLLIVGPWYFQSEYAVLFDSYSVPATLVQAGVLKCYCPEHAVGLVSLQVVSGGSIISNSVVFEYKKRPNYEENSCHNFCNIKAEQYNQYMYENDTLLKFILIHRIEAIQDDAYTHSSSLVNKYEEIREKDPI